MIRRLLALLLLLALGFSTLWLALGREAFTAKRSGQVQVKTDTPPTPGRSPSMGGIDVQPAREGTPRVTFSIEGAFEVQPTREVPLADGSKLLLPTYRLHADDTRARPEADNLMEMSGVTVELFRLVGSDGDPRTEKSGELTASTVLVEIERDAQGRPSIHQDREMDFRDAVFRNLPAAGLTEMILRVGRARLRTTDSEAVLRTAEREPFTLELLGDQRATMTGKGLLATIPTGDAPGPIDVRVLADPELVTADGKTSLRARGELHFLEAREASGSIDLHDHVEMSFVTSSGGPPLIARGDRVRAGLQRARGGGGRNGALWEWVALYGSPAFVDAGQAQIECERLDVLPSAGGSMQLLSASGTPTRVTLSTPGAQPSVLVSERRVHLLPIADSLHEWIGPLGFPRGALGPRFGQLIVFVGQSSVSAEQTNGTLELHARDGLMVLRGTTPSSMTTVRGLGAVSATMPGEDVALVGTDGLLLHDMPAPDGRDLTLTMGSGDRAAPHFDLRRGDSLHLEGHGRVEMRQQTRGELRHGDIDMTSPGEDGVLEVSQGTLRAIRQLHAELEGGSVRDLDASGARCTIDAVLRDGAVHCEATSVRSTDGRSFVLRGSPARVVDASRGTIEGERVDLLAFGDASGLRARGRSRLRGQLQRENGAPVDVDMRGDLAELLPWRVPPRALAWHAGFMPASVRPIVAASWRTPHVHLRGDVTFDLTDPNEAQAENTGHGDELWLQVVEGHGGLGLLLGQPAGVRVTTQDQSAEGEASAIAFRHDGKAMAVTLLPAVFEEASMRVTAGSTPGGDTAGNTNALGVRELTVYCDGRIEVEERVVRFLGPVRVVGDETNDAEPTLSVTADGMTMQRDANGAVTEITADGGVDLTSARAHGQGDTLILDLKRSLAVLRSQREVASIEIDGGHRLTGRQLELDYTTHTVRAWYGDVRPREGR
ncbi:MAG: hypothetical protein R3F56_22470 [Planctomycetota bacterium]